MQNIETFILFSNKYVFKNQNYTITMDARVRTHKNYDRDKLLNKRRLSGSAEKKGSLHISSVINE